jgi:hypothetical protein
MRSTWPRANEFRFKYKKMLHVYTVTLGRHIVDFYKHMNQSHLKSTPFGRTTDIGDKYACR